MTKNSSWQETLDDFLADNSPSADTRVLARALADAEPEGGTDNSQNIADLEQALHIEQNLDTIGLQSLPTGLEQKLQNIGDNGAATNVVWHKFTTNWRSISAIAATFVVVTIIYSVVLHPAKDQQPTLAEMKQAEQELAIALEYLSIAQAKSSDKIWQTFDENIQRPLNESLLKPLNHFKESS